MTFRVDHMRGYSREWWVRDSASDLAAVRCYRHEWEARQLAEMLNAGYSLDAAERANAADGYNIVHVGSPISFFPSFSGPMAAVIVSAEMVARQEDVWQGGKIVSALRERLKVVLKITAAIPSPGYHRGELIEICEFMSSPKFNDICARKIRTERGTGKLVGTVVTVDPNWKMPEA